MGCGTSKAEGDEPRAESSSSENVLEVAPSADPKDDDKPKQRKAAKAAPEIKGTKAQELLAKKKQEEKEEEERRRNAPRGVGTVVRNVKNANVATKKEKEPPSPAAAGPTNRPKMPDPVGQLPGQVPPTERPMTAPAPVFKEKDFEGFTTMKVLGKGSFGTTYECGLRSCKVVCVKIIELGDVVDPTELAGLRQEITLMQRFNHPNIVQYYGATEDKAAKTINIFMEFVTGGALNNYAKKFPKIPYDTVRDWARQMVLGIKYLHDNKVVHRDIKGANILVTNDGVLKLADFGCSKSIDQTVSKTRGCQTMVGTPYWMAPEVLKCEPYGTKSDIWSIGCTIVEVTIGKAPWPEMDNMWAAVYKIANSTGPPPTIPKDCPPKMTSFLDRCFQRDPKKRASADELLAHPWLQGM